MTNEAKGEASAIERPPPMRHGSGWLDAEFVIPIDGVCFVLGISHRWEHGGTGVKLCSYCGAEHWFTRAPREIAKAIEASKGDV